MQINTYKVFESYVIIFTAKLNDVLVFRISFFSSKNEYEFQIGTGADAFEEMQKMLQKTKGRVLTTFAAKDANSTTQRWMIQKGEG